MAGDILDFTRLGQLSLATDGQSVSPALFPSSETSLGFYRSTTSHLAQSYGTFVSRLSAANILAATGTITTLSATSFTISAALSMTTSASAANAVLPSLVLLQRASGFSLVYVTLGAGGSGISVYNVGNSAVSGTA